MCPFLTSPIDKRGQSPAEHALSSAPPYKTREGRVANHFLYLNVDIGIGFY